MQKKHKQFIEIYSADTTHDDKYFAEQFGVSQKTIVQWKHKYSKEIDSKIQENIKPARKILLNHLTHGCEELVKLIDDKNSYVRLNAIKTLFDHTGLKASDINTNGNFNILFKMVDANPSDTEKT